MNQRALWLALATATLCAVTALWFSSNFELVTEKRYEGMQAEARRNPFLAAERLFSRLGRKVTHIREIDTLTAGNGDGVLILKQTKRAFTPEQAKRLLQWVERGAYLIADVDFSGRDFLEATFDVERAAPSGKSRASGGKDAADQDDDAPYVEVVLPGDPLRYRLVSNDIRKLTAAGTPPEWHAGQDGMDILHYTHGRGNVTLFGSLRFLDNRQIGQFDHAELVWALLQRYQPGGAIHLLGRPESPSLWRWLTESAWMALLGFALLIVLWLWSVIPRFGGLRATPETARRDLAQHLLAIGRSLWREGGLGLLRELTRREVAQRLAVRHPALDRLPANEHRAALARMTGLDERDIREALEARRALSPEDFTRTMRTLQRLEQKL
jgi:hypothetical protein